MKVLVLTVRAIRIRPVRLHRRKKNDITAPHPQLDLRSSSLVQPRCDGAIGDGRAWRYRQHPRRTYVNPAHNKKNAVLKSCVFCRKKIFGDKSTHDGM